MTIFEPLNIAEDCLGLRIILKVLQIIFNVQHGLIAAADIAAYTHSTQHNIFYQGCAYIAALGNDGQIPRRRIQMRHGAVKATRGAHDPVAVGADQCDPALTRQANHLLLGFLTVISRFGKTGCENQNRLNSFMLTFTNHL